MFLYDLGLAHSFGLRSALILERRRCLSLVRRFLPRTHREKSISAARAAVPPSDAQVGKNAPQQVTPTPGHFLSWDPLYFGQVASRAPCPAGIRVGRRGGVPSRMKSRFACTAIVRIHAKEGLYSVARLPPMPPDHIVGPAYGTNVPRSPFDVFGVRFCRQGDDPAQL